MKEEKKDYGTATSGAHVKELEDKEHKEDKDKVDTSLDETLMLNKSKPIDYKSLGKGK